MLNPDDFQSDFTVIRKIMPLGLNLNIFRWDDEEIKLIKINNKSATKRISIQEIFFFIFVKASRELFASCKITSAQVKKKIKNIYRVNRWVKEKEK